MKSKIDPPWRRFFATVVSPFRHAVSLLRDVASQADLSIDDQARWNEAIGGLLIAVIQADHRQTPEELEQIEKLFTLQFGKREAQRVKEVVAAGPAKPISELCQTLKGLSAEDRGEMIRAMLEMAIADEEVSIEELGVVREAARGFGFDVECVERFREELVGERQKRSAIVKSGAGIAVALAVIGVFVFTATFLKSVLFGLILAYLFWPLQRFFQHRFFPHPWIQKARQLFASLGWPIHSLVKKLKGFFATESPEATRESHESQRRTAEACHATVFTVLAAGALGLAAFLWVSSIYVAQVGQYVVDSQRAAPDAPAIVTPQSSTATPRKAKPESPQEERASAPKSAADDGASAEAREIAGDRDANDSVEPPEPEDEALQRGIIRNGLPWLERYRPLLARSTILQAAAEQAELYLTDEEKKKELAITIFHNLHPMLIRAGGLAAMTGSLVLDMLMTMFFFTFFLQRIASGQSREGGHRRQTGEYLVETIFDSGWLPNASAAARREGQLIIDDILGMLKTWLRGYLWIIAIDTVLYTTIFMLLGIPYAPALGLLAGLTILLPFIGPIVSCSLTLLVAFSLYSQSITLMVTIVICYLVIHGVIEQLILYPALVGEALGLNSLETIIIVLLGGLVSGLAGAVFAVPVAAILKYLIPKIYQTFWQAGPPKAGVALDSEL